MQHKHGLDAIVAPTGGPAWLIDHAAAPAADVPRDERLSAAGRTGF